MNDTTTKHTPGPWLVDGDYFIYSLYPDGIVNRFQCLVSTQKINAASPEEMKANARLIAAAPTMLEALEALHAGFLDGSIKFTKRRQAESDPYHPANVLMTAALTKAAEGE